MKMQIVGISLLVFGLVALIIGLSRTNSAKQKNHSVSADRGSVAVGRDNHAPINVTSNSPANAANESPTLFWSIWNIANGIISIIGLALAVWPAN